MRCVSPLEALARGLIGGLAGSYAINAFFKSTARYAPKEQGAFEPPDARQKTEQPAATVARRTVEDLMRRGPLSAEQVARGGEIVHYAYGAGWGALYGLLSETVPLLKNPIGGAGFGVLVGVVSGTAVLPGFRLGPSAKDTPPKALAYNLAGHAAYGLALYGGHAITAPEPYVAGATYVGLRGARRQRIMRSRMRMRKMGLKARKTAVKQAGQVVHGDTGRNLLRAALGTAVLIRFPFARKLAGGVFTVRMLGSAARTPTGRRMLGAMAGAKALGNPAGRKATAKAAKKYAKAKTVKAAAKSRAGRKALRRSVEARI